MSQPRKRQPRPHRPTEYEEIAHKAGWSEGFDSGYQSGRDDAMYERGHQDGWTEGVAQASCAAYDAGYQDARAGRPPQHQPHTVPDNVSDLINPDAHE
jgi:flagellar biosynthesis/type III secretory pathway protein FliH